MKAPFQLAATVSLVASFCFFGFSFTATRAEYDLRGAYRALGLKKMAPYLAKRFSKAIKERLCGKTLLKLGIDVKSVEHVLCLGLLLKLSPTGQKAIHEKAIDIVADACVLLENGLKKTEANNLYTHLKKLLFCYLLDQLCSYDTMSFRMALTFAGEKNQKGLTNTLEDDDLVATDFAMPIEWYT